MRNIEWTVDVVKKAMTETKKRLLIPQAMQELNSFNALISYLPTALSNINEENLKQDIVAGIDKLKDVINQGKSAMESYEQNWMDSNHNMLHGIWTNI